MYVTILRVKKPVSRASQESQISLSRDMSISQYPVGSPSPPTLGLNIDRCIMVVCFNTFVQCETIKLSIDQILLTNIHTYKSRINIKF